MGNIFKKLLLVLTVSASLNANASEGAFVTIGTGGQTGVYYVVGQSICRFVNLDTKNTGIKCNAPSSGGSVDNINAINSGSRQFGNVQSDAQYQAYKGTDAFEGKGNEKLRAVFSMHSEPFTIVARDDSGINTFSDLKGKRVNIGNPGSGTRTLFDVLLAAKGWTPRDFAVASELKPAEMASALCDNNLDAITYTVGHPSGAIKEAAASCDVHLVSVDKELMDTVVSEYPYYAIATIPGGTYDGTDGDVSTIGVLDTIVSSTDVPDAQVYEVTKAVFDNFDRFKRLHPAFSNLKPENMIKDGLSIPLHDGALKFYKEKGWME